jgi:8-oxo-dGTP pyrophosphatase MutT (NUDIX family)
MAARGFTDEVRALARDHGEPLVIEKQIPVAPGLSEEVVRDFFADRWGEVVMVVRRATDGRLWTMTKPSFPEGLYSLPTGGIRHGEGVLEALGRELREETGFELRVSRFLAVIRYVPVPTGSDAVVEVPPFTSYAFLIDEPEGKEPDLNGEEQILDFKAIAPRDLPEMAEGWRGLMGSSVEFHDLAAWGLFRGLTHEVVGRALRREDG